MKTNVAVYTVLFFLTSILIVSCHEDSDNLNSTFSQIEKCMDTYPDSALNLLRAIPHPENLTGKAQADYALLMTQAMDKNYIKFNSDSLITVALNYYTVDQREPAMYAKVQFYHGRVMLELDRQEDALKSFLFAKRFYDSIKEYKMLALISEEIGIINRKQKAYDYALSNFRESLIIHNHLKDSIGIVGASQNIARVYLFKNEWDSCFFYFNQALDIAKQKVYISESSILQELGVLYRQKGDLVKSESYFLLSLKRETNEDLLYLGYLSLGYLYLQMCDWDKAREFLVKSTYCPKLETQKNAYNCLYWLEKDQGRFKNAIEYVEKVDSINTVIKEQNSQAFILDLQKKYENEKLQRENLQMRIKYSNIIGAGALVILFVSSFMYYYYLKNKRNKKKFAEIEWQIRSNEDEIAKYRQELTEIEGTQKTKDQTLELNRNKIGELNGKIMLLSMQTKTLTEQLNNNSGVEIKIGTASEQYVSSFRLFLSMKDGALKRKLSKEDREKLFRLFDLLYMNYVSRLQELDVSLTKHDLELCCFLRLGLSNEELGRIFHTSPDSVTKAKGRLKGRLSISSGNDLEVFLRNF